MPPGPESPVALLKIIDRGTFEKVSAEARASPRLRANWNLHESLDDPIQRFFNALEPGTYARPHRHRDPDRWECFVAMAGAAAVVTFDDEGSLVSRVSIGVDRPQCGVELPPGVWHSIAGLTPGTVLFELKPGPYQALTDKDFAGWAPAEGDPACAAFEAWFRTGQIASSPPRLAAARRGD